MKAPSIRLRLILASVLVIAGVLGFSKVSLYTEIKRSFESKVDSQLLSVVHVLSKTSELKADGVVYEWQEALKFDGGLHIDGLFQFRDEKTGKTATSPELSGQPLEFFHGALNEPVFRDIHLPDGTPARAVAILHHPFVDHHGFAEMKRRGLTLDSKDYPQTVVYARSTAPVDSILRDARHRLWWTGLLTLAGITLAIIIVIHWMTAPLAQLARDLARRTAHSGEDVPPMPPRVPSEMVPLVHAFQDALRQTQDARTHERELAAHAAHQLRTPLAGIHSILEMALIADGDRSDLRHRIESALVETRHMRDTINSLMRLARLRGGMEEIATLPFQPGPLIARLLADRHTATSHPVESTGLDSPLEISGDQTLVSIMLSNLIDNAFRYSPPGSPIHISLHQDHTSLIFQIRNAKGHLTEADLEKIFTPFHRGGDSAEEHPGAGLGLPLAREIAMKCGGTLHARITGADAIFQATLPLKS